MRRGSQEVLESGRKIESPDSKHPSKTIAFDLMRYYPRAVRETSETLRSSYLTHPQTLFGGSIVSSNHGGLGDNQPAIQCTVPCAR